MTVEPGQDLLHYRIVDKLGEGGMGVVWRATDTTLGREVAIKVLPDLLPGDSERMQRFEREARLLASLNHSHIATVHGFHQTAPEESSSPGAADRSLRFLVMELVEGEDLEQQIDGGPIPLERTIEIATQVALALEAAHGQGVVHRDLKPANVKLTPAGDAKVLDFGLAKALAPQPASGEATSPSLSPTLTSAGTLAGTILGTAAYMSPEQARGQDIDERADLWAFGVLLYEMLTGRRCFRGDTISDTLAAVLKEEPDWLQLPDDIPPAIRRLLRRCLAKDPRQRLSSAADVRLELSEALAPAHPGEETAAGVVPSTESRRAKLSWIVAAIAAATSVALAGLLLRPGSDDSPSPIYSALLPFEDIEIESQGVAVSPDGTKIVFVASDGPTSSRIYIQDLSEQETTPLDGSEGGTYPFWSPDSAHIAFFADRQLKRVPASGGAPQILAEAVDARGGTWNRNGEIVYAPHWREGLWQIPASGGTPAELTQRDLERGEISHRFPRFLPGGDHVLVLVQTAEGESQRDESTIELVALADGERSRILAANSSMAYSPSGHLLYWREGTVMAQPFDADARRLVGDPVAIASDVAYSMTEHAAFAVSESGLLAFQGGYSRQGQMDMVVVDRSGNVIGDSTTREAFEDIALSRDGSQVAYGLGSEIMIRDISRGTSRRLTFEDGDHWLPLWGPGDEFIIFSTDRSLPFETYRTPAQGGGPEERLTSFEGQGSATDVSPDGKFLLFRRYHQETDFDVELYSIEEGTFEPVANTRFYEDLGRFSPDGRWVAHISAETVDIEVSIVSLSGDRSRLQVSNEGGTHPMWNPRGGELFFMNMDSELVAVALEPSPSGFEIGPPAVLFPIRRPWNLERPYDVMPDGRSFLVTAQDPDARRQTLTLVQNWPELLSSD